MDAMDEFEDRKGFLPIISRFAPGPSSTLGSSRNDSTIFKIFVTKARKIDADIELFIASQLKERSGGVIMDQDVKDKVAQSLISKSNGMFPWIQYQLDYLYEQTSLVEARTIAQRALMWVVNTGRPLTLGELALAASIEPDSTSRAGLEVYGQQLLLHTCCIPLGEDDGIVRPVHYTVQEFLTASGNKVGVGYMGNSILCQYQTSFGNHFEHAQICLQYFHFEWISSGYAAKPVFEHHAEDPFLSYAAGYWVYRVQKPLDSGSIPRELIRTMDKFLDSRGPTLRIASHMRSSVYLRHTTVDAFNYGLAFNMLHLYKLSLAWIHRFADGRARNHRQMLVDSGADVNLTVGGRGTALAAAVGKGHDSVVKVLLANGADVNSADSDLHGALETATMRRRRDLVQLPLDKGAVAPKYLGSDPVALS
ncbi:hypothetical protein DFP73DRAFT_598761 [Morchella snyderi]|nr:hypothetical protein DFP73DRAFT_598761 [Morchella snyderi]